jgi:hypothetical protein
MFQTEIGRGLEVSSDRDCHMRNLRCNPIRDSIYDPNRFDSDRDVNPPIGEQRAREVVDHARSSRRSSIRIRKGVSYPPILIPDRSDSKDQGALSVMHQAPTEASAS